MTIEAAKEMDRKCVLAWLNEVYIAPSLSYNKHTDEEIRIFAHDALVLLNVYEAEIRRLRLALDIVKGTCKGIKSGGRCNNGNTVSK